VVDQPSLQPAPVVRAASSPATETALQPVSNDQRRAQVHQYLKLLSHPDERARREAALQLGRLKAKRAADPLAATLAGDASPSVRETAARALGLIGAPQSLTALQRAAQADADRDVRHSAQFAVEVIQANRPR
jgi:HEAT repeat protein